MTLTIIPPQCKQGTSHHLELRTYNWNRSAISTWAFQANPSAGEIRLQWEWALQTYVGTCIGVCGRKIYQSAVKSAVDSWADSAADSRVRIGHTEEFQSERGWHRRFPSVEVLIQPGFVPQNSFSMYGAFPCHDLGSPFICRDRCLILVFLRFHRGLMQPTRTSMNRHPTAHWH